MENGELWQQRYKTEQILEVACPKCGAAPHQWCDRTGERLSKAGQALRKAGTPPSHQERMWFRQGHEEHEFPALREKQRPGWTEAPEPGGKRGRKPAARGGCVPCRVERRAREWLSSPQYPADFPCGHGKVPVVVPGFPQRYTGERVCPSCRALRAVEVVVAGPSSVGYRCGCCGGTWAVLGAAGAGAGSA